MRAAVTCRPGEILFEQRPQPGPVQAGHVLLRVEVVGVCGSDVHIFGADGEAAVALPLVQGHEISAVVEATGPGCPAGLVTGARVAVWPLFACGTCGPCRVERPHACHDVRLLGVHIDGGFQDLLQVPADHVFAVGDLPAAATAMVEPVSVAVHALRRGALAPTDHVAVLGGGPIGQAVVLVAIASGARVMLVEPVASRREAARLMGAATASSAAEAALEVASWSGGNGPGLVLDTTGIAAALQEAVDLVAAAGRVVVVGIAGHSAPFHPGPVTLKELDVLGSSACGSDDFADAVTLVRAHAQTVSALVSHLVPLDAVGEALHLVARRDESVMKVAVDLRRPTPAVPA
jgi:L-gulonate 5-dehydrogenase